MSRSYLDPPCPIAAPATPPGYSALAVVRCAGPGTLELVGRCFSRPEALLSAPGGSFVHGMLQDPASGQRIDEVVVSIFRAPASPTGEDQAEISCHGSPAIVRGIMAALERAGAYPALPGEFTFRSFINGKLDLARSEAVDELVHAESEGARREALKRLDGGLSRRLVSLRSRLLDVLAEAEVRLDYAEEDGSPEGLFPESELLSVREELRGLSQSYAAGRIYREGARLAVAGRTNAGKSSLFNALLREERAIVSPEHGTTRDWLEAGIEVAGVALRLIDTAGLREAGGVEAEGIERSRRILGDAELLLYVVDGAEGLADEDEEALAARPDAIKLWNKVDRADCPASPPSWIAVSAREGRGFQDLIAAVESALERLLAPRSPHEEIEGRDTRNGVPTLKARLGEPEVRIARERHKILLDAAVAALDEADAILYRSRRPALGVSGGSGGSEWLDAAALELRIAADAVGEITGEIASPELLEHIFSSFCLGK